MQCIFCHKDSSTSKSVEHIIPESLGNKHHYLPKGYVCDACNNYFSIKIEKELLAQPYFVSMRFRNEILTKKGHFVKEKLFFPEVNRSGEVMMYTTEDGFIEVVINDEELYDLIEAGKTNTMIGLHIPEPEYPNTNMSRFLAKCAYEFFLYNVGKENFDSCVQELLGSENDILKTLREYARYGKGEYWQYHQRRLLKSFYDYVQLVADNIAEVSLANAFKIPSKVALKDDAERLSFSMADVNPMLIKKNDDRIH